MNPIFENHTLWDTVVVGGGPSGATAAEILAREGRQVLLLDRDGRIKPCGGAVPPRLLKDFEIPDHLIAGRASQARMVSPSQRHVDMTIDCGTVGMVNREVFDEWLRQRAAAAGAVRASAECRTIRRDRPNEFAIHCRVDSDGSPAKRDVVIRARTVVGTDGARSVVARSCISGAPKQRFVAAYHEVIRTPAQMPLDRCDIYYLGRISPDFYGWVFPHGDTTSVGVGSACSGHSLRGATASLRAAAGLQEAETLRREGAPIPLRVLPRWDDGQGVVIAGDAAGAVAPASGEGIYYAMHTGRLAAESVLEFLRTGDVRVLAQARRRFLQEHGRVFWVLRMMQWFWYSSDARRERFVSICKDPDVQQLTWQAYLHKKLVRHRPAAHARIFLKDMGHLLGLARV